MESPWQPAPEGAVFAVQYRVQYSEQGWQHPSAKFFIPLADAKTYAAEKQADPNVEWVRVERRLTSRWVPAVG